MTNNARVRRTLRTCRDEWPALRWRQVDSCGGVGAHYGTLEIRVAVTAVGRLAYVTAHGRAGVKAVFLAGMPSTRTHAKTLRAALRMVRRELVALDEAPAYVVLP